jgi:ketosteroid isomerase-like protein
MSSSPAHLVQTLLANPLDLKNVRSVTADDVTYVSLGENNPELKRVLPWAGANKGPEFIVKAFEGIGRTWETKAFEVREVIEQADNVALFGSFTLGRESSKEITSPFSPLARVKDGKVVYVQFLEDSFGTSRTVNAAT